MTRKSTAWWQIVGLITNPPETETNSQVKDVKTLVCFGRYSTISVCFYSILSGSDFSATILISLAFQCILDVLELIFWTVIVDVCYFTMGCCKWSFWVQAASCYEYWVRFCNICCPIFWRLRGNFREPYSCFSRMRGGNIPDTAFIESFSVL